LILPATRLKAGMIIKFNDEPCRVTDVKHVTPGKGYGMVQAKMKNLNTGSNVEHRFRSDDKFEKAFLEKRKMQYLYSDGGGHHFMDLESYEPLALDDEALSDCTDYLIPELEIEIEYYDARPVAVELPNEVVLTIVETEPQLKGATASASYKPAKLQTGVVVQVPPYIESGQRIRVDTRDGTFISKAD
jgi:elongation factor P